MIKNLLLILTIFCSSCTTDKEIQHKGTNSDLMLPSPCTCLPVYYQPPLV
ncbi:MAG: hypothetical protein LBS66_02235 [Rhodospirillaceae bacterium]|nr:hypothetical protein [Rhodospirillaceae bacterium]